MLAWFIALITHFFNLFLFSDLSADSAWDVMDIASNEELDSCCRRRISTACCVTDEIDGLRPKSFLHDEMDEFNQIFAELVEPKRRFLMRNLSLADICEPDVEDILSSAVSTDNELEITQNGTLNCTDGIEPVVCSPVAANQLPSTLPTCSKYKLSSMSYHEVSVHFVLFLANFCKCLVSMKSGVRILPPQTKMDKLYLIPSYTSSF